MVSTGHIRTTLGFLNINSLKSFGDFKFFRQGMRYYTMPIAFQIQTYSDNGISWIHPDYFIVNDGCEIIELVTHSSRRLCVMKQANVTVLDMELNFSSTVPEIGMCMPRYQHGWESILINQDLLIPLPFGVESKYKFKLSLKLNEELGWLIGVYIGDGWTDYLSGQNTVNLANRDVGIVSEVKRILDSLNNGKDIHFSIRRNQHDFENRPSYSEKLIFSSKAWSRFFPNNVGHGAKEKHLPELWVVASQSFRWGLLSGLIDTDGTVAICKARAKPSTQTQISYHTTSERLANQVSELAYSLGLVTTITKYSTPKGGDAYNVVFTKESILRMQVMLNLRQEKRRNNLAKFKSGTKKRVHKYAPKTIVERMKELRSAMRPTAMKIHAPNQNSDKANNLDLMKNEILRSLIGNVIGKRKSSRGALTYDTAREVLDQNLEIFYSEPYWMRWKELIENQDFGWEIIVDLNPVQERGISYGFVLPKGHSVITGSGLLV